MKKLILSAALCFAAFAGKSQILMATNTSCEPIVDVAVEGIYYDGTSCITMPIGTIPVSSSNSGAWAAPDPYPGMPAYKLIGYKAEVTTCTSPVTTIMNLGDPAIFPNCLGVVPAGGAPGCAAGCNVNAMYAPSGADWTLTIN